MLLIPPVARSPPGKQRPDHTPRNPAGVWVEFYFEAGGQGFKTRSSSTPNLNSRETYVINRPAADTPFCNSTRLAVSCRAVHGYIPASELPRIATKLELDRTDG